MPSSIAPILLMVGAGGHARMCVEILDDIGSFDVLGAVSADGRGVDQLGIPVLGRHDQLGNITEGVDVNAFCVAVGDNHIRQRVTRDLTQRGWMNATLVSPHAVVSRSASLGPGCQLMPAAVVTAAGDIGAGTIVNTNASVDHDARVGEFVHIAPGVAIGGDVTIGDRSLVGIGARVLPGVAIGADVVIGAGAVVTADVPDGVTVVGVPARRRNSGTR